MTITGTVRLAAIVYDAGFKIDDFLTRLADRLRADHIKARGHCKKMPATSPASARR